MGMYVIIVVCMSLLVMQLYVIIISNVYVYYY